VFNYQFYYFEKKESFRFLSFSNPLFKLPPRDSRRTEKSSHWCISKSKSEKRENKIGEKEEISALSARKIRVKDFVLSKMI
jgi:hypothetical protein